MAVTLLLAILSVAAIVQTWMTGAIFARLHRRIALLEQSPRWWLRIPARGLHCHYCLSHWVAAGIGVSLYLWPDPTRLVLLVLATIIPANMVIVGFAAMADYARKGQGKRAA